MVTLDPYDTWTAEEDYPVIRYAAIVNLCRGTYSIRDGIQKYKKSSNDRQDRCGMPDVPTTMLLKKKKPGLCTAMISA